VCGIAGALGRLAVWFGQTRVGIGHFSDLN
jgi:hypothetical protein